MAKIRNPLSMTVNWNGPQKREVYIDSLVKENNWTIGCEVGVRKGRTLFHLLDNNPTLKMYAVDKDISQFYNKSIQEKYNERLIVFEGISWNCAEKIKEKIDFVFIDAGHSTKSVTKDINAYTNVLKRTNGLIGHDIDFPAIQYALDNLNIKYNIGPDNTWISF
jgi:predicted O-methyltransferase YrrM